MDGGRNSDDGSAADLIQIEKADRANDALKLPAIVAPLSRQERRRLIRRGMKHQKSKWAFQARGARGDEDLPRAEPAGTRNDEYSTACPMCFDAKKWCGQRHYSKESLQPSYSPFEQRIRRRRNEKRNRRAQEWVSAAGDRMRHLQYNTSRVAIRPYAAVKIQRNIRRMAVRIFLARAAIVGEKNRGRRRRALSHIHAPVQRRAFFVSEIQRIMRGKLCRVRFANRVAIEIQRAFRGALGRRRAKKVRMRRRLLQGHAKVQLICQVMSADGTAFISSGNKIVSIPRVHISLNGENIYQSEPCSEVTASPRFESCVAAIPIDKAIEEREGAVPLSGIGEWWFDKASDQSEGPGAAESNQGKEEKNANAAGRTSSDESDGSSEYGSDEASDEESESPEDTGATSGLNALAQELGDDNPLIDDEERLKGGPVPLRLLLRQLATRKIRIDARLRHAHGSFAVPAGDLDSFPVSWAAKMNARMRGADKVSKVVRRQHHALHQDVVSNDMQPILRFHVSSARDLVRADKFGTSDPYVKILLNDSEIFRTSTIRKTLDPVWGEVYDHRVENNWAEEHPNIAFEVFDSDIGTDDFLGRITFEGDMVATLLQEENAHAYSLKDVASGILVVKVEKLRIGEGEMYRETMSEGANFPQGVIIPFSGSCTWEILDQDGGHRVCTCNRMAQMIQSGRLDETSVVRLHEEEHAYAFIQLGPPERFPRSLWLRQLGPRASIMEMPLMSAELCDSISGSFLGGAYFTESEIEDIIFRATKDASWRGMTFTVTKALMPKWSKQGEIDLDSKLRQQITGSLHLRFSVLHHI